MNSVPFLFLVMEFPSYNRYSVYVPRRKNMRNYL
jgi:hypothetical protein